MRRFAAATLAASLVFAALEPAACAHAQAAAPFPPVPLEPARARPHRLAYASLIAGAGLVGLSFTFGDHADRSYARYLAATQLGDIDRLYDEATRYDRYAAASLLTGEALLAAGVWLRFLRDPPVRRLSLDVTPTRCALALRF